jgi:hypothetical protein
MTSLIIVVVVVACAGWMAWKERLMTRIAAMLALAAALGLAGGVIGTPRLNAQPTHPREPPIHGLGHVHMDTSCAPSVSVAFDRALALLHNFWYARALTTFTEVIQVDPQCAMAYWGAAMTYNHPFWDAPSPADVAAARALVQQGLHTPKASPREQRYLAAVAALYQGAGSGGKSARDEAYKDAMAVTYAQYPDDEAKLFYGLSMLGTVKEGAKGFERQAVAAKLFEEVYANNPHHPGVLHYLIHVYDEPVHAADGLTAARAYATTAAAVPHAQHMPSHIFTRLGYWEESAATNENAWRTSEADVQRAGEPGEYRDFHTLNYLQYAYLQLGRYRDAKRVTDLIQAQYDALATKTTAPDTPDLQARHVRGRTIYALPDRVVYGYFDMLTRYLVEAGAWAEAAAERLVTLSTDAEQHPLVKQILTLQATEAQAIAAQAVGDLQGAITRMNEAVALEEAIDTLSQPPYPIVPAHEFYGTMLLEMHHVAEAERHFAETLTRTPGRPKAIYGLARAAEARGDTPTATTRYTEFLELWTHADQDRPELARAQRFLATTAGSTR